MEVSIIIIAFAGLSLEDEVRSYIQESSQKEMSAYNHVDHEDFTKAWDTLQQDVSIWPYISYNWDARKHDYTFIWRCYSFKASWWKN